MSRETEDAGAARSTGTPKRSLESAIGGTGLNTLAYPGLLASPSEAARNGVVPGTSERSDSPAGRRQTWGHAQVAGTYSPSYSQDLGRAAIIFHGGDWSPQCWLRYHKQCRRWTPCQRGPCRNKPVSLTTGQGPVAAIAPLLGIINNLQSMPYGKLPGCFSQ